jgi:hypothetical protein
MQVERVLVHLMAPRTAVVVRLTADHTVAAVKLTVAVVAIPVATTSNR